MRQSLFVNGRDVAVYQNKLDSLFGIRRATKPFFDLASFSAVGQGRHDILHACVDRLDIAPHADISITVVAIACASTLAIAADQSDSLFERMPK